MVIKINPEEEKKDIHIITDDKGCLIELPPGTIEISTNTQSVETGSKSSETVSYEAEHDRKSSFTPYFTTQWSFPKHIISQMDEFNIFPYHPRTMSELIASVQLLKAEINEIKIENERMKKSLNELRTGKDEIELLDLPNNKIEKIIIKYLKKNKGKITYPSDIAFASNLDYKKVFDICQKLKKEGKLI